MLGEILDNLRTTYLRTVVRPSEDKFLMPILFS